MDKNEEAAIMSCDDRGDFLWLTEKGERRICRVLTVIMAIAISPVFAVMLLM